MGLLPLKSFGLSKLPHKHVQQARNLPNMAHGRTCTIPNILLCACCFGGALFIVWFALKTLDLGLGFIFPMLRDGELWSRLGYGNATNITVETSTEVRWHTFTEAPLFGAGPTTVEVTVTELATVEVTVTEVPLYITISAVNATGTAAPDFSIVLPSSFTTVPSNVTSTTEYSVYTPAFSYAPSVNTSTADGCTVTRPATIHPHAPNPRCGCHW